MHELILILIDESDRLSKAQALHFLALNMAHQEAIGQGLTSLTHPRQYADQVFPRCDQIEAKLRRIIDIGPP
jgi:hypothetical protein